MSYMHFEDVISMLNMENIVSLAGRITPEHWQLGNPGDTYGYQKNAIVIPIASVKLDLPGCFLNTYVIARDLDGAFIVACGNNNYSTDARVLSGQAAINAARIYYNSI